MGNACLALDERSGLNMLFNSLEYAFLLVSTFVLYQFFAGRQKARIYVLLAASYIFYAGWNAKYLSLIFFSSSVDFVLGHYLGRINNNLKRKILLTASLTVNLGILCVFKYFNFFSTEVTALLNTFGIKADPVVFNLLLPVGISFYTFQTLSYTIDIYRRKMKPCKSYPAYLLFVSFFPQLVAGPIVRARALIPQILSVKDSTERQKSQNTLSAVFRIGVGLAKKMMIADVLGSHLVDPVFSNPQMYSSVETLAAVYGYAFQIYADFSAYSDIAIGSAALFGFKIPENFNSPYLALNLRDFWRRWHISLSSWLRDYLYIPLGGSHKGAFRTSTNIMVTMLLGGLWHGAGVTFIIWGAIHGIALLMSRIIPGMHNLNGNRKWHELIKMFITFHIVTAAWIFFRASSLATVLEIFKSLVALDFGILNISRPALLALLAAFSINFIPHSKLAKFQDAFLSLPSYSQALALIAVIWLAQMIADTSLSPFIYFQF